ncbi:MAG: DNA gyrase subunit A [Nevskiales bacterium]|nr:DNA gyrase subunit A [Nevskiales bacterium]
MTEIAKELLNVNLEDELRRSYLDYAMSVIVGRALPDARDGLKPVHRRVLYAMRELGNDYNKPYKKSARVVGDVIGKYHPHGDTAVYDTIVRLAQDFSMRYVLVDGQGNFGSVDGDAPAAMRYTEVRMSRLAQEMLVDLDRDTVDFVPNYDESESEPAVLPARIPQLLVNGSSGIAVGMATNIPPHNLGEVIDGCVALIDNPDLDLAGLMKLIPAPDFPTAGILLDANGLVDAYATGRGRIVIRSRTHFEDVAKDRQAIVVTELPYQINKARVFEKIAELVKDKKLEGISELRDESDKDGMRMVIELKRGENAEVVLNNLFQQTQLQDSFSINMVALDAGQPRTLPLKELLQIFLRHRREVVTRRTRYLLREARKRAHVLEGLTVALANIDEVIALIKASAGPAEAKAGLMAQLWKPGGVTDLLERTGAENSRPEGLPSDGGLVAGGYRLSDVQAQAILDLKLHRLTGLEQDKIRQEFREILDSIAEYLDILAHEARLLSVVRAELLEIKDQYADERRTEISEGAVNLNREDLVTPQEMVVTLSHEGYVKTQPLDEYRAQRRGGKGKIAAATKEEDFVDRLWTAHSHDTLLCFSSLGRVYKLRVFELPLGSRGSRGKPFVNLLPLEGSERINAVLPIKAFTPGQFIFFATRQGTVKKCELTDFLHIRANGIIACELRGEDRLVDVALTDGHKDVLLFCDGGRAIRFSESDVRAMGRQAAGVIGMRLKDGEAVIALMVAGSIGTAGSAGRDGDILTVAQAGYGKRTRIDEYPVHGRGGQGVIAQMLTEKSGRLVGAIEVHETDEVMLISEGGQLIRTAVKEISVLGRNTRGVRVMRPAEGDRLVGLDRIEPENGNGNGEGEAGPGNEAVNTPPPTI